MSRPVDRAMQPAAFLDRDGVLNTARVVDGVPYPPRGIDELRLLPLVAESCAVLHDAGIRLIVVTNQPDIARGATTRASVDAVNDALRQLVAIDEILVCPHDDRDGCSCRKPLPGMILDAAERHHVDLERSVMVGDRWRDVAAGQAARVATVFLDRGYDERQPVGHDLTAQELHEATPFIISRAQTRTSKPCQ